MSVPTQALYTPGCVDFRRPVAACQCLEAKHVIPNQGTLYP